MIELHISQYHQKHVGKYKVFDYIAFYGYIIAPVYDLTKPRWTIIKLIRD